MDPKDYQQYHIHDRVWAIILYHPVAKPKNMQDWKNTNLIGINLLLKKKGLKKHLSWLKAQIT